MKTILCVSISLIVLSLTSSFGQTQLPVGNLSVNATSGTKPTLTKFNLDFPGGTVVQLVKAIEEAMGKPLNVIIPDEDTATKIPELHLHQITFEQLAATFQQDSFKTESRATYNQFGQPNSYTKIETGYSFQTTGTLTDNSIWYFIAKKAPPIKTEKVCRFYRLEPFLNRGFTVDDITTAIQTGWKMANDHSTPELKYHKETQLLIAYGERDKLENIESVLSSLPANPSKLEYNLQDMNQSLHRLEKQVDELKKQMATMEPGAAHSAPAENSGK